MDLAKLNGATVRVPLSTTRLSSDGLNLCGIPGQAPAPTDIVYIMDQSTSMVPRMILPGAEDTSGWFDCNNTDKDPAIKYIDTIVFHGQTVAVAAPKTTVADMRQVCQVAGDPYTVRLSTVQNAVKFQAEKSPSSYASIVSFHGVMDAAQMTMTQLSTPAKLKGLLDAVPLMSTSGTNYEEPLTWARIQLYGGESGANVIPPSADSNKAIILISDGQPNKGTWRNALKPTNRVVWEGDTWTTTSTRIPKVYTIYLGLESSAGAALSAVAQQTGGTYHQIPPNMPDSLTQVLKEILGKVIKPAIPDSLFVTNQTNGQSSKSVSVQTQGNSYRMRLDSLVALEPGSNSLSIKIKQATTTITANWTVLVADSTATYQKGPLDSVLGTRCGPASTLTIKPDKSGLAWADTADRNLILSLQTVPENNTSLPIDLVTRKSSDKESIDITVPTTADPTERKAFSGTIPWQTLAWEGAVPGDLVVRSGPGWDSVRATFQMPRDRRDTASAVIGLHRPITPVLTMTGEVDGPTGRIQVTVVDSELTSTTLTVIVKHRLGDSVKVKLSKGSDGVFQGSFPFAQGVAVSAKDTVLQLGAAFAVLDSVTGTYLNQKATSTIRLPTARLRFVDESGEPHDTLSASLLPGEKSRVTVQAYIGENPCLTCSGWVRFSSSDEGISVRSIQGSGGAIDSLRLVSGKLQVDIRGISPVRSGNVSFASDSLGSTITARPLKVSPLSPDSVVYFDDDGDGTLDRADLHLRMPWQKDCGLRLPWPDSSTMLDVVNADISYSDDAKVVVFSFKSGAPLTTATKSVLQAQWRYGDAWDWTSVKVVERIAPVPLRAVLRRGAVFDTLRIASSERIWPTLNPASKLVSRVLEDERTLSVSPRTARVDGATGELVLIFPTDSTELQVNPGDSIRFARAGALRDSMGNVPGEFARKVIVEGLDKAPESASIYDIDADGRADRVVVRLKTPLSVTDHVGFRWPSISGELQIRELPVDAATFDASDRVLTFDLDPFEFGATSCPPDGCQNLAWFSTTRFKDLGTVEFPLLDKVDPIILTARFEFSASGDTPDSVYARYSEPMTATGSKPWLAWGRPSTDSMGTAIKPLGAPRLLEPDLSLMLVDSTFPAGTGDSLRVFARSAGALVDAAGNAGESFVYWTRIEFGKPPLRIKADVPRPLLVDRGWSIPVGQPPVTILVRRDEGRDWTTLSGQAPLQPIEQYSGVTLSLNRIPEGGGLYLYDLVGTAVVHLDLAELLPAAERGAIVRTRRGDYEIFLAWDGLDMNGQKASTGIYVARILGWVRENNSVNMVNTLKKIGLRRELPINMRMYTQE